MVEHHGVQTGFATINGGKLYYEVAGNGPVLVLAHAGIADRSMWDDQFLVFAQHYRVIRFDFWGFGKSTIARDAFLLHQDLYRLLKLLAVAQAHLVGCSLGGRVIIDLALEYPGIAKSLIVVSSGLSGYQFAGEVFTRFVEQIMAAREQGDYDREIELKIQLWVDGRSRTPDQVDPRVRERAREMLLSRPGGQGEGQLLDPAAMGRLGEIDVPTLIIVGDRDEANIATIADLLAVNIHKAQKIIIPDAAHLLNMEKPEDFNRVVLEFLRSNRPGAGRSMEIGRSRPEITRAVVGKTLVFPRRPQVILVSNFVGRVVSPIVAHMEYTYDHPSIFRLGSHSGPSGGPVCHHCRLSPRSSPHPPQTAICLPGG